MAVTTTAPTAPAAPAVLLARSWKAPIWLALFALVAVLAFASGAPAGETSTFGLSLPGDDIQLSPITVTTTTATWTLALVCVAIAAASAVLAYRRRSTPIWALALFGVAWVLAFLVWAVSGATISLTGLLAGSLLLAVPIAFGAQSGILCERAGVINIAIEGHLLAGAFGAAVVASLSGSLWLGLAAAPLFGLLVALLLVLFAIRYFVDQIIVGVVLNVLVIGLTGFLFSQVLSKNQSEWNTPGTFQPIKIPLLGDIPVIGPVFFNQSIIVYLLYAVVAVLQVALFRSRWGLRVRAVGEHPEAADTVGIKVNAVRTRNVLIAGAVAGLGGAFFTLGAVGAFGREMTAGKGFIALAAMIFGRYSPVGAVLAALLFGFADNLQNVLTIVGAPVPSEFMLMAPYLVTIFAVAGLVGRVRVPAADGKPYIKS
jgi:simple sugar transport system permease protein